MRLAPILQALSRLMGFQDNKTRKSPSNPAGINAVSIWPGMESEMYSPFQTHTVKKRIGIFFYISLHFPWNTCNAMYRVFRKALRQVSIFLKTWNCQECIWGALCCLIFFIIYWNWCADRNRTWGLCRPQYYCSLRFLWFFGGYSEPHEDSKT